jgi:hypothetical protein
MSAARSPCPASDRRSARSPTCWRRRGRPARRSSTSRIARPTACSSKGRRARRSFLKELPNGFTNPDFRPTLEGLGRKNLILVGFMTHMCVDSTARAAVDLGYGVTIVENATASRALPGAVGKPSRSAQEVHDGALAGLADLFAVVVPDTSKLG